MCILHWVHIYKDFKGFSKPLFFGSHKWHGIIMCLAVLKTEEISERFIAFTDI